MNDGSKENLTPFGITAFLFCISRCLHKIEQAQQSTDEKSFRTGFDVTVTQMLAGHSPFQRLDANDRRTLNHLRNQLDTLLDDPAKGTW